MSASGFRELRADSVGGHCIPYTINRTFRHTFGVKWYEKGIREVRGSRFDLLAGICRASLSLCGIGIIPLWILLADLPRARGRVDDLVIWAISPVICGRGGKITGVPALFGQMEI